MGRIRFLVGTKETSKSASLPFWCAFKSNKRPEAEITYPPRDSCSTCRLYIYETDSCGAKKIIHKSIKPSCGPSRFLSFERKGEILMENMVTWFFFVAHRVDKGYSRADCA